MKITVLIKGPIASGKTILAELIKLEVQKLGWVVREENDDGASNFLEIETNLL